jgi:hypothetical protein
MQLCIATATDTLPYIHCHCHPATAIHCHPLPPCHTSQLPLYNATLYDAPLYIPHPPPPPLPLPLPLPICHYCHNCHCHNCHCHPQGPISDDPRPVVAATPTATRHPGGSGCAARVAARGSGCGTRRGGSRQCQCHRHCQCNSSHCHCHSSHCHCHSSHCQCSSGHCQCNGCCRHCHCR